MTLESTETKFDLDQWQAGKLSSFSQTCFAEYWEDLPLVNEIVPQNNTAAVVRVDPYNFSHRMGLEKVMIEHTGGGSIWGDSGIIACSQHPMWGYAAQLDWQHRSGRYQDPSEWPDDPFSYNHTRSTGKISKRSWWGYMNLQFGMARYCGAAEAGLLPKIVLLGEISKDADFLHCVAIWKRFWQAYQSMMLPNPGGSNSNDWQDAIYRALWKAHAEIIQTRGDHSRELEAILPFEDRNAGLGWANMVELLAATNWPLLSLDSLCKFGGGYLPSVRLAGPQTLEWLQTHRPLEYTTVQSLYQLFDTPPQSMRRACVFFGRVSRWRFAVQNLPRTLHVLTHGNFLQKTLALSRVLVLASLPNSIVETGVALVAVSLLGVGKIANTKKWLGI